MLPALSEFAGRLHRFIERPPDPFPFDDLAWELFELQYRANLAYRRLCLHRSIGPGRISDWRSIPAAFTVAFKELDLTSLPSEARTAVFHSSGTTAHRASRHFHNAESLALYQASLIASFRRHVLPDLRLASGPGSASSEGRYVFLSLTPAPDRAPHSSLVCMLGAVMQSFATGASQFLGTISETAGGSPTWQLEPSALCALQESVIEARTRNWPVIVLGTALNFVHLLDAHGRRSGELALPPGSRVMETGGYKGRSRELPKSELHASIANLFSIPLHQIVTEYGMCELSSQAYDRTCGETAPEIFRFPPWVRTRIISPETGREVADGETGLLRVFDLANVWSVMAVQTEDLALCHGDGFELLGRAPVAEARGCSLMFG